MLTVRANTVQTVRRQPPVLQYAYRLFCLPCADLRGRAPRSAVCRATRPQSLTPKRSPEEVSATLILDWIERASNALLLVITRWRIKALWGKGVRSGRLSACQAQERPETHDSSATTVSSSVQKAGVNETPRAHGAANRDARKPLSQHVHISCC